MSSLAFLVLVLVFGRFAASVVYRFLNAHRLTAENYRRERIPVGFGIAIWAAVVIYTLLSEWWVRLDFPLAPWLRDEQAAISAAGFAFLCSLVVFAGWLDDTAGETHIKGLRGHFAAWFKEGRVTTGLVKVVLAAGAAVGAAAMWERAWWANAISVALIVLMTNTLNLFDLRPGRALKVYFAGVFAASAWLGSEGWMYVLPAAMGGLIVFPKDLQAKAMLGDTGSNLLGFALGTAVAATASIWLQAGMAVLLLLLHGAAEKMSISELIRKNKLLSWLDRLGRTGAL